MCCRSGAGCSLHFLFPEYLEKTNEQLIPTTPALLFIKYIPQKSVEISLQTFQREGKLDPDNLLDLLLFNTNIFSKVDWIYLFQAL